MAEIPPGMRAEFDRELEGAIAAVLEQAAHLDGLDLIEANTALTNHLLGLFNAHQLAAAAAMLATRLHRHSATQPGGDRG